ncbi:MAG: aspartate/glutamate racemase family protein [Rhodospirillales bacterium]|nr:aspartate/glutamate racemase family protein [Rhodospirillales bacterium]
MTGRMVYGGKNLYGARLGFLMLDVETPRMPGDVGNAATWPFPVLYGVVPGANPRRVVNERGKGLLDAIYGTAQRLVKEGADGIASTGGFFSIYQAELAARCEVPVATSSLMQIPLVERLLPPGKRVGVITVQSDQLSAEHLEAAGAAPDTPVVGTENGREFSRVFHNAETVLNAELAELDILDAGQEMVSRHPEVGAIVFECHNMAPFARSLRDSIGMPVFSVYSFFTWFHAGLEPRDFGHPGSAPRDLRER